MPVEVEIVGGPSLLDALTALGTVVAALAAAWAAWVANRQNKRLTERKLQFQSRWDVQSPHSATVRLTVTNDSFRPIRVNKVGFMPAGDVAVFNEESAIDGTPLPVTLQDGEGGEWSFDAALLINAAAQYGPVLQMFAADSHGNLHTEWYSGKLWPRIRVTLARRRNLRRFKRQALREAKKLRRKAEEERRRSG